MTETVKRYVVHYDGRGEVEHPNGDFVHWISFKAVKVRLENREEELANAHKRIKGLEASNEESLRRVREGRDEALKIERTMLEALEEVSNLKKLIADIEAELHDVEDEVDAKYILNMIKKRL